MESGRSNVPIPNNPVFVGVRVYFQSATGAVTSNGGEVRVGNR